METERFFTDLASRLETARRVNLKRYRDFFTVLAPRLEAARGLDIELDRQLARRFNVFKYLKTDELGLSAILADLLNPRGPHGQGTFFLQRFVKILGKLPFRPNLSASRISDPVVEMATAENGRFDIYLQIDDGAAPYCLAIENKPYARDQKNQVKKYLEYLSCQYGKRFVLIYLSPKGEGPRNRSLPTKELGKWSGKFAILPYLKAHIEEDGKTEGEREDGFEEFRLPYSLADWFKECRRDCDVDRLRWFLRDAEAFCQRQFGGQTMTNDCDTKLATDFVLSEPEKNLEIAYTVYKSWPAVRERICTKFSDNIRSHVKDKISELQDDIQVEATYGGKSSIKFRLWLYRRSWTQYEVGNPDWPERIAVRLEVGDAPKSRYFGIVSPLPLEKITKGDTKRSEDFKAELRKSLGSGKQDSKWLWWNYVEHPRYGDWESRILGLYRETEKGNGKVMKYYVDLVVKTAKKVMQIISDFDRENA